MMNVCVFGSSSKSTETSYVIAAYRLGELIAERGHTCVNGAGRYGVMGGVNNGCSSKGGKIVGVIHSIFCVDTSEHPTIKDLLVVGGIDLYQRKLELFNNSDCVIVLPGGVGTFDELWDGISSRSLAMKGMSTKPICIVNLNGYYDGSIMQMHRAKKDGILYEDIDEYFHVEDNVEDALRWCEDSVHSSRKIAVDTHERKVERMVTRFNNISETVLEKPDHVIRHPELETGVDARNSSGNSNDNPKDNSSVAIIRASRSGKLATLLTSLLVSVNLMVFAAHIGNYLGVRTFYSGFRK